MPLAIQALEAYDFAANIATVPVALRFAELPDVSQLFIVEYGMKQYAQDGAAVSKKDKDGNDKSESEIATEKVEGVQERIDNLLTGEFTRRSSAPKMTPEEKHRLDVVMGGLKKFATSINKPLPTRTGKKAEPEKLDALIKNWYAKYQTDIDREVARRLKAAEKPLPVEDMTDMAALLG